MPLVIEFQVALSDQVTSMRCSLICAPAEEVLSTSTVKVAELMIEPRGI